MIKNLIETEMSMLSYLEILQARIQTSKLSSMSCEEKKKYLEKINTTKTNLKESIKKTRFVQQTLKCGIGTQFIDEHKGGEW